MIEFLKVAAPLMTLVSVVLVFAGLIPSLRRLKVFHFLCGEFFFVTAIAYGGLVVLGTSSFDPFRLGLWFIMGSVEFAHATFLATQ